MRNRRPRLGLSLVLVTSIVLGVLCIPSIANAATPKITLFTASTTSLPEAPTSLTLTVKVANATTCKFTVAPSLTGLPKSKSCSAGSASVTISVPANVGTSVLTFVFKVTATKGAKKTSKTVEVVQDGLGEAAWDNGSYVAAAPKPGGNTADAYYVGANGQIYRWHYNGTYWSNSEVGGGGEPALCGICGLATVWQPKGSRADVFYDGANGELYDWTEINNVWTDHELGGEAVSAGNISAAWQPGGTKLNVFYVGGGGQIYDWFYNGTIWTDNGALGSGEASNDWDLTVLWKPGGTTANVYYEGANDQVYNWYFNGSSWSNGELGGGGEATLGGTGMAAVWDGSTAKVYYVGGNYRVYNWSFNGTNWTDTEIGGGSGGEVINDSGMAAAVQPSSSKVNVYYESVASNNQICNWYYNGFTWANGALDGASCGALGGGSQGTAQYLMPTAAFWIGNSSDVFYDGYGSTSQVYEWHYNGSSWSTSAL